jgi:hypothetical protein
MAEGIGVESFSRRKYPSGRLFLLGALFPSSWLRANLKVTGHRPREPMGAILSGIGVPEHEGSLPWSLLPHVKPVPHLPLLAASRLGDYTTRSFASTIASSSTNLIIVPTYQVTPFSLSWGSTRCASITLWTNFLLLPRGCFKILPRRRESTIATTNLIIAPTHQALLFPLADRSITCTLTSLRKNEISNSFVCPPRVLPGLNKNGAAKFVPE